MKRESHTTTWTAILLGCVNAWRKRDGLSREAAAVSIVQCYMELGAPTVGGEFRSSNDVFEDARINAQRIFRWLDDATKDTNLLGANFTPAILKALPEDLRLRATMEMLGGVGLVVEPKEKEAKPQADFSQILTRLCKEAGEAHAAVASLTDGVGPGELEVAQIELREAVIVTMGALSQVEAMLKSGK